MFSKDMPGSIATMNSERRTATASPPAPLTRTTEEDDLLWRFLKAAEERIARHDGRIPLNTKEARAAISWLRGLVGILNDDGSVSDRS